MINTINESSIEALSRLAYELGPFFFSLLFLLVILLWAHRCYRKVNIRKDPEASPEEKKCYKTVLVCSYISGLMLVFISVGWWMYAHVAKHTLQGTIVGLRPPQQLFAYTPELYLRSAQRAALLTDYHFAIVRDSPFALGQKFILHFYPEIGYLKKETPAPIILTIDYSGKSYEIFELIDQGGRFTLKRSE